MIIFIWHIISVRRAVVIDFKDRIIKKCKIKKTSYLSSFLDFYLYSSLHIGICAMAMTVYVCLSNGIGMDRSYVLFVGSSTFLTYSLHRLIGIRYSSQYLHQNRFAIVKEKSSHIQVYALLSSALCIILFLSFSFQRQVFLVLAAVVSLLYILPLFTNGRRLRDLSTIKIFLIALVWSFVTVAIPLLEAGFLTTAVLYKCLEMFCFVMAITIPFDIRDMDMDRQQHVSTLANSLGVEKSKRLSYALLGLATLLSLFDPYRGCVSFTFFVSELTYILTGLIISKVRPHSSDYWYTGLLDGTMILFILIDSLQFFVLLLLD